MTENVFGLVACEIDGRDVVDLRRLVIPQSGMRPESLAYLRAGGTPHGDDIQIGHEPKSGRTWIISGRHRLTIARERDELVEVTLRLYGPRGGLHGQERVLAVLS